MENNRKRAASMWFYQTLYQDEQIRPRPSMTQEPVPEEIRAMRELERDYNVLRETREELFVREGRMMADFEDDYVYNRDVVRYFPTYQSLTDRELRGYFTWRARWRRGEKERTSLSFAFLYVYELLNQIGVRDAMDGFEKLYAFWADYGALDSKICAYLNDWLFDYVIYYRLDPVLLEDREELRFDRMVTVLREPEGRSDRELLDAIMELSSYRLDRSRLYVAEPEALATVTAQVLRSMTDYYARHRKQTLTEDFFGPVVMQPYTMFASAVFYEADRTREADITLNPLRGYQCRNGRWSVRRLNASVGKSKRLGDVMRTVDSLLREALGVGNAVQPGLSTKWVLTLIQDAIADYRQQKAAEEARHITIDYSKLSGIRLDASVTRDKLIVDEERGEESAALTPPIAESVPEELEEPDGLDAAERRLLHSLLYGESLSWLREQGLLPAVLADRVNEKLFDRFGDTVLIPADLPELVEDYMDELKEMIQA